MRRLTLVIFFLLVATCLLTPLGSAPHASSPDQGLFAPPNNNSFDLAIKLPPYKRKRLVTINPSWLIAAESSARNLQPGSTVRLRLFNDADFTLVVDRVKFRSKKRFVVKGHLLGIKDSIVLLAFVDHTLAASIHVPGRDKFMIGFAGHGHHWIWESDGRYGFTCDGHLPPP